MRNYGDLDIDGFCLYSSKPDYSVYDFGNFRCTIGPVLTCSNLYTQLYSRTFFDTVPMFERLWLTGKRCRSRRNETRE